MNVLIIDSGLPFQLNTPYKKSLGGSETNILLFAKGLALLGEIVVILNNSSQTECTKNLTLHNIKNLDISVYNWADIVIVNRYIPEFLFDKTEKPIYYYAQDAYDQSNIVQSLQPDMQKLIHKYICVSNWQKQTLINYFDVLIEKTIVLGNMIDVDFFNGYTNRNLNKMTFASIPFKGLEVLGDIFTDVCIRTKRDDLELDVISSMSLYNRDEEDVNYEEVFVKLSKIKGVHINKPVSMIELATKFLSSSLYIHPQTYHETFGINFIQSQAAGCIPITTNKGSARELIDNSETGYVTQGKNIENMKCYNEFVQLICNCLDSDLQKIRYKCQNSAFNYNYVKVTKKFLEEIV